MNNNLIILTMEAAISLGSSVVVIHLVHAVLHALLQDLCHGAIRAAFWSTFTRLMLLISPLLMVLLFSHSLAQEAIPFAQVIRDALLHALLGQFIGLLIVGGIILSFSRHEPVVVAEPIQPEANGEQ